MSDTPTLADGVAGKAKVAPRIGRFEIRNKLGEGGMGVVYEGYDKRLDREVALKLVRVGDDVQGRARLMREAQAMAKVAHPNVVPIYEVGEHDDQVFVAMELVPGQTLSAWLEQPRTWREVLAMYVAAGRGLAAAHAAGIVHRDFKPDNVLVGRDDRPRVLDFGLARAISERDDDRHGSPTSVLSMELTMAGSMMGTPGYMSPEHFRGENVGPASDQFGFAAGVFRALYGKMPFKGETLAELRDAVCAGKLEPFVPDPELPAEIVAAVERGLSADPSARFPTIEALLEVLERPLRVDPDHDPTRGRGGRRAAIAIVGVAALAGIVAAAITGAQSTPATLVWLAAAATVVLGLVGVAARRSLAASAHNRRLGLVIFAFPIALVLHRALAWHLGAPAIDTLIGDAVTFAFGAVVAGITLERWIAYGGLIAAAYIAFALADPGDAATGFGAMILVCSAAAAWRWRR